MKPIVDRGEVSIDFPDKAYYGAFGRAAQYEARADAEGVAFKLAQSGEDRREAELHLHWYLFADLVTDLAEKIAAGGAPDEAHADTVRDAARRLVEALGSRPRKSRKRPG